MRVHLGTVKPKQRKNNMKKMIFSVLAGVVAMGAAQAQTVAPTTADTAPHAYVGISTGASKDSLSGDRKRTVKIFGGYEFDQNWGVEAGYTHFGSSGVYLPQEADWTNAEMKSFGAYVAAKYTMPITERSSVYGKLGLSHTETKLRADWDYSDRDNNLYGAVGVQVKATEKISLFAEYEHYGKRATNGPDNKILNAGVKFGF
jgi:opacity protein-like surface antigen